MSRDYTLGMQKKSPAERRKVGAVKCRLTHVFMACLLLLSVNVDTATADSFRCGRKVIRTGDSPGDLLEKCGKPRHKDKGYENLRVDGSRKKVRIERWYYKKSSRRLEQIVLIHQGRIVAINTGRR